MATNTNRGSSTKDSYPIRIFLLLSFISFFIVLIIMRLFSLQILSRGYYQSLASNQHDLEQKLEPKRGEIFLNSIGNNPVLVATNITKNLVYAVPKEIKDPANISEKLAPLLEITPKDLAAKISQSYSKNYLPLKKQLAPEVSEQIKKMGLAGVYLEPESLRYYPEKRLASQILGFVGYREDRRVGQYGIEGEFEDQLAGVPGEVGIEKDVAGRWMTLTSRKNEPAVDGDSIYLTLDSAIQFKAEQVLADSVQKHGAEGGSVVVMNPKSGAILAMANYPDFDPNDYGKVENIAAYNNSGLVTDYEPGSVFKPITMAAGLNEGKVSPDTTYQDAGEVRVDDAVIKNSDLKAYGTQTMTQVLEGSLNTGAVYVQQQLGHDLFKKYVEKFGFGKPTGLELPGEVGGNLSNLNKKGDIFFATGSFGQGITATPIQLVTAYAAIANEGKMMKPYLVSKITHPDGTEQDTYPAETGQVIDQRIAVQLSAMLVGVVESGHGKRAGVKGYYIAGKTGTAQVAYKDRSGYDPSRNIGSFIGFGPVDDPQFVMLVKIDSPKDVRFAESTAAPAFGEIASFILRYYQIPPTRQ